MAQALEASVVIAIMLQMCQRLGLLRCKRQGEYACDFQPAAFKAYPLKTRVIVYFFFC